VFQLTIWSIPPIAAACIAMAAYLRARPRDHVPGGHALRFLFLTVFIWSSAQAVGSIVKHDAAIMLAAQFAYIGIALAPVAWFVFALTYAQRVRKLSRHALNTVSFLPMITLLLALSNSDHGLVWTSWEIASIGGFRGLITEHGFWFYVHAVYSYSLILVATSILAFSLIQYKQHYQTMLAAVFAPLIASIANVLYLSPLNPYPWLDLTPLGFVLGVLILDIGILRTGLLNAAPVVRDRVVEQLKDPVLVLNHRGNIIDANVAALRSWDSDFGLLGSNIASLIPSLPTATLMDTQTNPEVTIDDEAYEIASTALDTTNAKTDVAIVFRDVTKSRETINDLRSAETKLQRMAHTDALTNMYNRHFFMDRLSEEFERIRRHGSVMSVLVFDLDHFKRVNDTFGHDLGDAVLVAISEVVNRIKRSTDIACRLGGEEFALLLPETDKTGAINLAQRLRRGIQEYPYKSKTNKELKVTASIGVATVTPQTREPESILKTADRALYKAKDGGRNMVCVDNEIS
jgi:diguanylate cyclase (GGDEF)-like protein